MKCYGCAGTRLAFGPATQNYFGLPVADRVTFVRTGADVIRTVVEGHLTSGEFVALDDIGMRREHGTGERCSAQR